MTLSNGHFIANAEAENLATALVAWRRCMDYLKMLEPIGCYTLVAEYHEDLVRDFDLSLD